MKIHFAYRHVDRPWGGANNFIRALHAHLASDRRFEFTDTIEEDCDVLFMNELGKGPGAPGRPWTLRYIEGLVQQPRVRPSADLPRRRLVVRAVNLNAHAFEMGPRNFFFGRWKDRATIKLLNMADVAIFQSQYQLGFFSAAGYKGSNYSVIYNGADGRFWEERPKTPVLHGALKLVSSTASPRASKCHYLVARLSMISGVEIEHLGAWPDNVEKGRVRLHGACSPEEMMAAFSNAHYLLHPAIKDPCPNAVFEGVCAGLPVIFNPGPGSSNEIVGACGMALDEKNLGRTVELARDRYSELRNAVLERRETFRIEHAAARYRAVFERLMSHPQ